MTNITKVTRKDVLNKVVSMVDAFSDEEREVATKMIASLEKRGTTKGISEKEMAQRASEMDEIMATLEGAMTATEIAKATGLSVQKISARLKVLVADGKVAKTPAKGKHPATFEAVTEE